MAPWRRRGCQRSPSINYPPPLSVRSSAAAASSSTVLLLSLLCASAGHVGSSNLDPHDTAAASSVPSHSLSSDGSHDALVPLDPGAALILKASWSDRRKASEGGGEGRLLGMRGLRWDTIDAGSGTGGAEASALSARHGPGGPRRYLAEEPAFITAETYEQLFQLLEQPLPLNKYIRLVPKKTYQAEQTNPPRIPAGTHVVLDCQGAQVGCDGCTLWAADDNSTMTLQRCDFTNQAPIIDIVNIQSGNGLSSSTYRFGDNTVTSIESSFVNIGCELIRFLPVFAQASNGLIDLRPLDQDSVFVTSAQIAYAGARNATFKVLNTTLYCSAPSEGGLGKGEVAGIVIGTLLGVLLCLIAACFIALKIRSNRDQPPVKADESVQALPVRKAPTLTFILPHSNSTGPSPHHGSEPSTGVYSTDSALRRGRISGGIIINREMPRPSPRPSAAERGGGLTSSNVSEPSTVPPDLASYQLRSELGAEHLQIHGVIARGGFGTVCKGSWRGLPVAVKTVLFEGVNLDNDSFNRAVAEASIANNLTHPNIVATYSHELKVMSDPEEVAELKSWKLYLVQELCNGGTLGAMVGCKLFQTESGAVHWHRLLQVLSDVARGMEYVHSKRIAHGDLNPNNILMHVDNQKEEFGEGGVNKVAARAALALDAGNCTAKIADFGLSTRLEIGMTHVSNIQQGTPFYSAPEVSIHRQLQPKSDVFSFGVIMWEMFHNDTPFQRQSNGIFERRASFPSFPPETPLAYAVVAIACMSTNPDERPTFSEVARALDDMAWELTTAGPKSVWKKYIKDPDSLSYSCHPPDETELEGVDGNPGSLSLIRGGESNMSLGKPGGGSTLSGPSMLRGGDSALSALSVGKPRRSNSKRSKSKRLESRQQSSEIGAASSGRITRQLQDLPSKGFDSSPLHSAEDAFRERSDTSTLASKGDEYASGSDSASSSAPSSTLSYSYPPSLQLYNGMNITCNWPESVTWSGSVARQIVSHPVASDDAASRHATPTLSDLATSSTQRLSGQWPTSRRRVDGLRTSVSVAGSTPMMNGRRRAIVSQPTLSYRGDAGPQRPSSGDASMADSTSLPPPQLLFSGRSNPSQPLSAPDSSFVGEQMPSNTASLTTPGGGESSMSPGRGVIDRDAQSAQQQSRRALKQLGKRQAQEIPLLLQQIERRLVTQGSTNGIPIVTSRESSATSRNSSAYHTIHRLSGLNLRLGAEDLLDNPHVDELAGRSGATSFWSANASNQPDPVSVLEVHHEVDNHTTVDVTESPGRSSDFPKAPVAADDEAGPAAPREVQEKQRKTSSKWSVPNWASSVAQWLYDPASSLRSQSSGVPPSPNPGDQESGQPRRPTTTTTSPAPKPEAASGSSRGARKAFKARQTQ